MKLTTIGVTKPGGIMEKGKLRTRERAKDHGVPLVADGAPARIGRVANGVARAGISRGIVGKLNARRKPERIS